MQSSYSDYSWSFLVAAPSFSGAFFEESVVLLLEDGEDGSFGVIINKSEGKTLGDINPDFVGTPLENVEVFDGGPIAKDRVSLAICYDDGKEDGAFSFGITPEKTLELLGKIPDAKIAAFSGYSGWGANQLKAEIAEGTWIVSNADVNVIFETPESELWKELLLRECPQFGALEEPRNSPTLN